MDATPAPAPRILVVDDEDFLRSLLETLLVEAGYAVTCAADGEEALGVLQRQAFELCLVDVRMPRLGGIELLARLKQGGRPVRAIIMTGDSTPETVLGAIREHAYLYITKPFRTEEMLALVKRALSSTSAAEIEVVSAAPHWLELLVPCERESAERIHEFLMQLKSDLPEEVRDQVGYAFRELLLNAVEWGGGLDPAKKVRISYLRARRLLLYRIADPGKGFRFEGLAHAAVTSFERDPLHHAHVRETLGMRPGGLGILMARAVADELLYNEAQNEVVFVKYLD